MKILLISATSAEIAPLTEHIKNNWTKISLNNYTDQINELQFLTTGVGLMATAYSLGRALQQQRFDLVLQAGIAGSYDRNIALGEVVFVTTETLGDTGAEDGYNFLDVFDLGLIDPAKAPFHNRELVNPVNTIHDKISLHRVSGLSVSTTAGSSFTAEARYRKYGCQVETMEGAALHFVCLSEEIPFAQIRSISNYVEARDRSQWKIREAVGNLNSWLREFVKS